MSIERINGKPVLQRIGNDSVYGSGIDGDVVIATNTTLYRDMYYNNLTINSGRTLNTNGFRVFVKEKLTVMGTIGANGTTNIVDGTVSGSTPASTTVENSIGGNAQDNTYQAVQLSASQLKALDVAVSGGFFKSPYQTLLALKGGAGGGPGAPGVRTLGANGSGAGAGGAGGGGHLNRNVGRPGGPGHAGTPGGNGVAGSTPPAAAGGAGGTGGPVVVIVAKEVVGNGAIAAIGRSGSAGGPAATGSGATSGHAGSAGSAAPGQSLAHHGDGAAAYITGDGTHGVHAHVGAPNLPRSFLGGAEVLSEQHIHRHVHRNNVYHSTAFGHNEHNHNCQGGYNYAHTYQYHDGRPHHAPASSFYHVNGINHSNLVYSYGHYNHHQFNVTPVHFPHCAHTYVDAKGAVQHNHGRWPHQHHDNWQYYTLGRAASYDVKSVGHAHYPGGAGGAAGAAGTPGTNGSTTAGGLGQWGGGGGIICVTDKFDYNIMVNTSGNGGSSGASGSGMIVIVENS